MEKSSFFNSVNGDRKYKAEEFASYFASFIGSGIFPNPSNNLQAITNNNMTISIKQGKAWINGYFYVNTDDLILSIDPADGILNRVDRIVLKLDFLNREIKVKVKKGAFASSPTAPGLQRDSDAYELALADIVVNKGVISITQANITDKRLDNNLCGIVHGVVDQVDVTTLFNQYTEGFKLKEQGFEQEFNIWFDTVKNTLGEDVAGNLLNLINNLAGAGRTTETVKGNADAIKTLTTQMGEKASKSQSETITGVYTFAGGMGANEGGEIHLSKPNSGTSLTGDVALDIVGDRFRFYAGTGAGIKGVQADINKLTGIENFLTTTDYNNLASGNNTIVLYNGKRHYLKADSQGLYLQEV